MSQPPDSRRATPGKARTQLIVIVLIAVASLGGSFLVFQSARESGVWGTTNHGTFVTPPLHIHDVNLRDTAGQHVTEAVTWWLWVVTGEACDEDCQRALHQLRQLHVLLNRDAGRVQRALVTSAGARDERIAAGYPRLEFLSAEVSRMATGIYIVDPLGNLVLYYPMSEAGKPVLEDLKRLLRVSQIG
jgi:cytochrome oxidase Cu insertion factor (SCO1/SenC/PrrC family)